MKILRIIARLNVGGPARHVVWLSSALSDSEYTTKLIAGSVPDGEEDMSYFAAEHDVDPTYLKEMSRELSPKDAVSIWKLFRQMRAFCPDIVHTHTAKAGTVGRIAALLYRWLTPGTLIGRPNAVKVVHTFHGHVFHSYYGRLKTRLFVFIERVLARVVTDRIIVITDQQLREINEKFRVGRPDQFDVVPLGIDLSSFAESESLRRQFRDEFGFDDSDIVVTFVGRLTEIKNISMFLRSASRYREKDPGPRLRFLIVGDGHLRERLEVEAKELELSDLVIFAGNRTDTAAVYAGTDIVALTSLNEGTPLSLIEAMAANRPVISTAVGGVVDLLGEPVEQVGSSTLSERGISVSSGDADSLCIGLIYLAANAEVRAKLALQGREFVCKMYSKDRLVSDIKELYARLLK
jgi:glycosyltransferase involved in cell wall biosynthesis